MFPFWPSGASGNKRSLRLAVDSQKFFLSQKRKAGLPPVVEVRGGVDRLVYNVSTTTSTGTGRNISYLERAAPWRNKARGWGHHPSTPLSTSFVFQLFISLVHILSAAIPQYSHFLVAKTWLQNLLLLLSSLSWPFNNCEEKIYIFQTAPQIWYCELCWWNDCPPPFAAKKLLSKGRTMFLLIAYLQYTDRIYL